MGNLGIKRKNIKIPEIVVDRKKASIPSILLSLFAITLCLPKIDPTKAAKPSPNDKEAHKREANIGSSLKTKREKRTPRG